MKKTQDLLRRAGAAALALTMTVGLCRPAFAATKAPFSKDETVYAVMAAEYTGEVRTPTFQECLFGLTGQWPEGEGYAAWQKAKLPRLRLGVPDGSEMAREMDALIASVPSQAASLKEKETYR